MSDNVQCGTCHLKFRNIFALGGHKQWCKGRASQRAVNVDCAKQKRQKVMLPSEEFTSEDDSPDVEEWRDLRVLVPDDLDEDDKSREPDVVPVNETYLALQKTLLQIRPLKSLKCGRTKNSDGTYSKKKGNPLTYLDIGSYAEETMLGENEATNLLKLMKKVTKREYSEEVPVPSSYKSLLCNVMDREFLGNSTKRMCTTVKLSRMLPKLHAEIRLPPEMFPNENVRDHKCASGMYTDIVAAVASMMIDSRVVGRRGQHVRLDYSESREVRNVNSTEFFRKTEIAVRARWGHWVEVLVVITSSDKTEVTRLSRRTMWPLYVAVGNLTTRAMVRPCSIKLCGFCPYPAHTKEALYTMLRGNGLDGRRKKQRKDCFKMLKHYNEQEFTDIVLSSIKQLNENGPVKMQFGRGKYARVETVMPVVMMGLQDTEGANQFLCVQGTKCAHPCRMCVVNRSNLYEADVSEPRSDTEAMEHIKYAFKAFCKNNRREELTEEEEAALLYCKEKSLLPIEPAVMRQVKPHPDFNWYNFCLPDVLHTELGGHQKDWIFWVCVVVHEVGKQSHNYRKNLQKLDELVAQFPVQQSVGIKLKRFHEGVSVYVTKASDSSDKKGMSTANLIGLNHQDVPSLVLQMLLCIGNEGAIIPKGMKLAPHLENLDVTVVRSGMRALNYFYNLRRQSFSKPDQVERLKRESASLHYDMTQLWRAKQLILKTTGNYGGIKFHNSLHIPLAIPTSGPPKVSDMIHMEQAHGPVKKMAQRTSNRHGGISKEIMTRIERKEITTDAQEQYEIPSEFILHTKTTRTEGYKTGTGVVYEADCRRNVTQRLFWFTATGVFGTKSTPRYINPIIFKEMSRLSRVIQNGILEIYGHEVLEKLRRNSDDCVLETVRGFKVDTSKQGIPVTSIVCCLKTRETSGPKARKYKRFDWITMQNENKSERTEQLIGLFVLHRKDRRPKFLYCSISLVQKNMGKNSVVSFPQLTYTSDFRFTFDTVDSIFRPAFVIPTRIYESDYYVSNKKERVRVTFTTIPIQFLLRDNWSKMDNKELGLRSSPYDRASTTKKRAMLKALWTVKPPKPATVRPPKPGKPPASKGKGKPNKGRNRAVETDDEESSDEDESSEEDDEVSLSSNSSDDD